MPAAAEEAEVAEPEPPAQSDPTGRWTRTNNVLGKGAFKTVYKGFDEQEGLEVAWNQIRLNEMQATKEDRERLFAEIRVLKQLKHKNIMTFYDSWLEQKGYTLNFITELFTSGTLRQYRKRHRHTDPEVMKRWAWQIVCGLVYLHGHTPPIIHRDLKCDNIFINGSEGVVKIGDMGLATMLRARTAPQSVLGTPEFMAPECYDEEYDDRIDVYSFGMCMIELSTLEYPYAECKNAAQIYRKVTLGIRPKALSRVASRELAEIITYCIQARETRPRSRQLLKHPYFDSIRSERMALKLGAEALGLPIPQPGQPELPEYAKSASRASSTAGDLQPNYLLEAVAEEEEEGSEGHNEAGSSQYPGSPPAGDPEILPQADYSPRGQSPVSDAESSREFRVKGRLKADGDTLSLRLRILENDGTSKMVEFDLHLSTDTAFSVASEMVEEMELSHEDAHKIAQAIREEIVVLTHKGTGEYTDSASEDGSHKDTAHNGQCHTYAHALQEAQGSPAGGQIANGHANARALQEAQGSPSKGHLANGHANGIFETQQDSQMDTDMKEEECDVRSSGMTPCSDSVTSVQDTPSDPMSPNAFGFPPRPESAPGGLFPGALSADSAELRLEGDALMSPPRAELTRGGASASLPPFLDHSKRPAETLLRHLGRTDSANHTQELEALQQALSQKGGSNMTKLFNLPKDEDRRLPLKKLLENLEGIEDKSQTISNQRQGESSVNSTLASSSQARLASMVGESGKASSVPSPRESYASFGGLNAPLVQVPDLRRASYEALIASSPASSTGKPLHEFASEPQPHHSLASTVNNPMRPLSPKSDLLAGLENGSGNYPRTKSKAELAEAKEIRLRAAQNSLKNMESHCLEGLDTFGIHKPKQVPIRSMMGLSGR